MKPKEILIRDKAQFQKCWDFIEQAFYTNRRLPDQVFRENFTGFFFDDNARFLDIFLGVQKSALNTNEQLITLMLFKYSRLEGHYQWDDYYPAFQLSINTPPEDFFGIFSFEAPLGDSIRYADITVCVPESLEWAIWQSYDLELCIIGFNKEKGADKIPSNKNWFPVNNHWVTIEKAITDIMPPMYCHSGGKVPDDIAEKLRTNYGT